MNLDYHSALVDGKLIHGEELRDYARRHGLCELCAQHKTHRRRKSGSILNRSWEPLTVKDKYGNYTVYKGYCLQPTCYTLSRAQELLGEMPGATNPSSHSRGGIRHENSTTSSLSRSSAGTTSLSLCEHDTTPLLRNPQKARHSTDQLPLVQGSSSFQETPDQRRIPVPTRSLESHQHIHFATTPKRIRLPHSQFSDSSNEKSVDEQLSSPRSVLEQYLEQDKHHPDKVLRILATEPDNAVLHLRSLRISVLHLHDQRKRIKLAFRNDEWIQVIHFIFNRHRTKPAVLSEATLTLCTFCSISSEYAKAVCSRDFFKTLATAMDLFYDEDMLQEQIVALIQVLSVSTPERFVEQASASSLMEVVIDTLLDCNVHMIDRIGCVACVLRNVAQCEYSTATDILQKVHLFPMLQFLDETIDAGCATVFFAENVLGLLWHLSSAANERGLGFICATESVVTSILNVLSISASIHCIESVLGLLASISWDLGSSLSPTTIHAVHRIVTVAIEKCPDEPGVNLQGIRCITLLLNSAEKRHLEASEVRRTALIALNVAEAFSFLEGVNVITCQALDVLCCCDSASKDLADELEFSMFALDALHSCPYSEDNNEESLALQRAAISLFSRLHPYSVVFGKLSGLVQLSGVIQMLRTESDSQFFVLLAKFALDSLLQILNIKPCAYVGGSSVMETILSRTEEPAFWNTREVLVNMILELICDLPEEFTNAEDTSSDSSDAFVDIGISKFFEHLTGVVSKYHEEDDAYVSNYLLALSILMQQEKNSLVASNCLVVDLLDVFASEGTQINTKYQCLHALTSIFARTDDIRILKPIPQLIDQIVTQLLFNDESTQIHPDFCNLCCILFTKDDFHDLPTFAIVRGLLDVIAHNNGTVVEHACELLCWITKNHGACQCLEHISDSVTVILACMESNGKSRIVQKNLSFVLETHIGLQPSSCSEMIANSGGIQILAEAVKIHGCDAQVVTHSLRTLVVILVAVEADFLWGSREIIVDALSHAIEASPFHRNEEAHSAILQVISAVCDEDYLKTLLAPLLGQIVDGMRRFIHVKDIQHTSFSLIRKIATVDAIAHTLVELRVVELVIDIMLSYSEVADLVVEGLMTVNSLVSKVREVHESICIEDTEDALVHLALANIYNHNVLAISLATLNNVVVSKDQQSVTLVQDLGLFCLIWALKLHLSRESVLKHATLLLKSYTFDPRGHAKIMEFQDTLIPILIAASQSFPGPVRARSHFILHNISPH